MLVFEIQKMNNGTPSCLVYYYDDTAKANQKYHAVLSAAAVSAVDIHSSVMLNDDGSYIKNESFYHGQSEEAEE